MGYHAGRPIESVVYCFYKITFSKMEFYRQKMWFKYRDQVVSSLYSHRKPITTHDFSSAELKTQLTFLHLSRTYVSRFAGKVDTHLCECTMKEYIYFFNIEAGD